MIDIKHWGFTRVDLNKIEHIHVLRGFFVCTVSYYLLLNYC